MTPGQILKEIEKLGENFDVVEVDMVEEICKNGKKETKTTRLKKETRISRWLKIPVCVFTFLILFTLLWGTFRGDWVPWDHVIETPAKVFNITGN